MIRLNDIAVRAGVHVSTVSKALRNSEDLNEETIKKIRDIANELGYQLTPERRPRRKVASHLVGVISPDISSNYYAKLLYSIQEHTDNKDIQIHVTFSNFDSSTELQCLKTFVQNRVSGIIYISENHEIEKNLKALRNIESSTERRAPIIVVAPQVDVDEYDYVRIDDAIGVTLAVEHLISLGHKEIAYIGDKLSMDRFKVYKAVLKKHGIRFSADLSCVRPERFEECGLRGMQVLISRGLKPTAVFAAYDDVAIGVMKTARDHGMEIPDDLSVVGIDDIQVSSYLHTGLTTVAGPISELGQICVDRISKKIDDPDADVVQHITLKPKLIVRNSTKQAQSKLIGTQLQKDPTTDPE